jgi:hypothetical protein
MLRSLHVTEKIGVMDDAGHVGFGKLDAAHGLKFASHEGILDFWFAICD